VLVLVLVLVLDLFDVSEFTRIRASSKVHEDSIIFLEKVCGRYYYCTHLKFFCCRHNVFLLLSCFFVVASVSYMVFIPFLEVFLFLILCVFFFCMCMLLLLLVCFPVFFIHVLIHVLVLMSCPFSVLALRLNHFCAYVHTLNLFFVLVLVPLLDVGSCSCSCFCSNLLLLLLLPYYCTTYYSSRVVVYRVYIYCCSQLRSFSSSYLPLFWSCSCLSLSLSLWFSLSLFLFQSIAEMYFR